eukprot:CAMPEP_0197177156 /NCGR_PEP_ID=MMETSP1423-20130617/2867_1 /TAXON_ID=476441 /ORGANISM="Pseudo-nitzschia heimii, Strain UNC1101" /LENGTH=766 /DNA_ID=CAMNT_0042626669 /DNA_START=118 /DNA_END=2418 /DNA_ORIENTATION=+
MTETNAVMPKPVVEETKEEPTSSLPSEYYAMIVDSGPIIKQDVRNLMGKAQTYVTTPSVMREIRDSKARNHLEHSILPLLDLKIREPSDDSMQQVIAFAKQTGDYPSLSTVDLQVLALTLDFEKEGNRILGNDFVHEHIRTTPKRKIGLGSILPMNGKSKSSNSRGSEGSSISAAEEKKGDDGDEKTKSEETPKLLSREDYDEVEESDEDEEEDDDGNENEVLDLPEGQQQQQATASSRQQTETSDATVSLPPSTESKAPVKKSWANLVNPTASSTITLTEDPAQWGLSFGTMSLNTKNKNTDDGDDEDSADQFDDASEEEEDEINEIATEEGLQLEFPSLLAASTVPFEGEDDEIDAPPAGNASDAAAADEEETGDNNNVGDQNPRHKSVFMTEEEKKQNLKPISKSGRSYNSFRKYKGLMKPKQPKKKPESVEEDESAEEQDASPSPIPTSTEPTQQQASRFLGGGGGGETMREEDDDGEGWITSSEHMKFLKTESGGMLDPSKTGVANGNAQDGTNNHGSKASGPHMSQRTACATTDFAMQNVLLQMNLILLSTEGMRIRRLKSWVIRCGACFHIHGADQDFRDESHHHMKRLFCSHCGSDMLQRISASVDGKTGRLKLHFSKRKQGRHHSIRGTKFSLPKPGSGNKYKGDLLLREDQLLSGAWNQKVKINSGRKHQTAKSHSMFGRDIASSVGCNVRSTSSATFGGKGWSSSANTTSGGFGFNADDIRVGFGARKNPNAAKGRERRGKKKKASDRACGMRRY